MNPIMRILHLTRKFIYALFQVKTQGVRIMVIRGSQILLIKSTYHRYWVLPGGGVGKNETFDQAGRREVHEEAGIAVQSFSQALGTYQNNLEGRPDTVKVFITDKWTDIGWKQTWEVLDRQWFDMHKLPQSISDPAKRRIEEYLSGKRNLHKNSW